MNSSLLQPLTTTSVASGCRLETSLQREGQSPHATASTITPITVALDSLEVGFIAEASLAPQFEKLVRIAVKR
jgi:hypothetical protein